MTQSLEDYIEAIYMCISEGRTAYVRHIADKLNVTMPSVVKAIRELKVRGCVLQEPYSPIELTEEGRRIAQLILDRHILLRDFLIKLGVSEEIANKDACRMEHVLSDETIEKIRSWTKEKSV